jgi:hypothetical protein
MSAPVDAHTKGVLAIHHGLDVYRHLLEATVDTARAALSRADARLAKALAEQQRLVRQAQQQREAADRQLAGAGENRGPLEAQAQRARAREQAALNMLRQVQRARERYDRVAPELQSTITKVHDQSIDRIKGGREDVRAYAEILGHYLQTEV